MNGFYMVLIFYGMMTVVGFFSMWSDKRRAKQHAQRTPEATLLWIAFLGGALGSLLGMQLARHKTRKPKFQLLVPLALLLHATGWILFMTA